MSPETAVAERPKGAGFSERFWTKLFLSDQRGPEVLKWVSFGRRLVLAVSVIVLVLGVGMTLLSTVQLSRLLEESLLERGRTIATAVARAAFVPLSLEDRRTLGGLAAESARQRDVASITVVDSAGNVWASAGAEDARWVNVLETQAPVLAINPGTGLPRVLGRVSVGMDASGIARRRATLVGTSLLFNGLFVTGLLSVGLLLIRNLTLRMQIMVDEARWVAELKRSNRELEEFAYVASHDLQSPLRKVAGFAELLKETYAGKLGPEADEYIAFITGGTKRMQRLIEDLLTYSRVGSRQLVCSRVDLAEVVREVLTDLEPVVLKANAKVEVGRMPVIVADRVQMGQLFQNLITNALKFRAQEPLVVGVTAERRGDGWLFSVKDNGIGMEAQYLDQIFKMFRRLHAVGTFEGTGIGLSITRKIVERHGGTIWAESQPGEGATFRFTLGSETSGKALLPAGGDDVR